MFAFRKVALWLVVLLVPGGILLLPLLIAEMRRDSHQLRATNAPAGEDRKTPNDDPKTPPSDSRLPRVAA